MDRWVAANGVERGPALDLPLIWKLAVLWYPDPRRAAWKLRTPAETQQLLDSVGLTAEFWQFRRGSTSSAE